MCLAHKRNRRNGDVHMANIRYESTAVAVLDLAVRIKYSFARFPLYAPRVCDSCGRTVTSVRASQTVTPSAFPCRRRSWSLRVCDGQMVRAA